MFTIKYIRKIENPKGHGTPGPQTILFIISFYLVACVIIWESWLCFFIIEIIREIVYAKGPGPPGPPSHIIYYVLEIGGQIYHLGKLNLFVYHWKCKGIHISQGPRDPGLPKQF